MTKTSLTGVLVFFLFINNHTSSLWQKHVTSAEKLVLQAQLIKKNGLHYPTVKKRTSTSDMPLLITFPNINIYSLIYYQLH